MSPEFLIKRAIARIERKIKIARDRNEKFSYLRLTVAVSGLILLIAALYKSSEALSAIALFLLLIVFNAVSFLHRRLRDKIRRYQLHSDIKQDDLNRLKLDWDKIPPSNASCVRERPFAIDLDIFGPHSLMRLIDTSTSKQAQKLLTKWLTIANPAPGSTFLRQKPVKELKRLHNFRIKFRLLAKLVSEDIFDGDKVIDWLNKTLQNKMPFYILPLLSLLSVITAVLFIMNRAGLISPWWSLSFIIYITLFLTFGRFIGHLFTDGLALNDEISKIQRLIKFIHKRFFRKDSALSELCLPLKNRDNSALGQIQAAHRLLFFMGLRENPIIRIIVNVVFPVDFFLNELLDRQKIKLLAHLPDWLNVLYELDALSALAGFAYLHPQYTFPEFRDDEFTLKADGMSHPLLNAESKKHNAFSLQKQGEIALITGSNMSGKSTFLRTVGINLVLAYAGSVVDASFFSASFFRISSCIRIDDSLSDGISYFYAEVKRLKSILNAMDSNEEYPVLFLIDEIYKGTNNRERLAGSQALTRVLAQKRGLGIITTHDLELTYLEKEIANLHNFHFSEQIKAGKMYFDYRLKAGPCPSTNALKIMEMEGLPVGIGER